MTKHEWLLARKTGIGASEIASVMGFGYSTDGDVYLDKINPEVVEIPDNDNMRRGREKEAVVVEHFRRDNPTWRIEQDDGYAIYRHPDNSFCFATPDRHVYVPVSVDGEIREEYCLLECKHTRREDAWKWKRSDIPEDYFAQVQWQLYCTGASTGFFAWIHEDVDTGWETFHWIRIERNDEFIALMVEIAQNFWLNHVEPRVAPDSVPVYIDSNEAILTALGALKAVTAQRMQLEAEEKALKELVTEYMGDATILTAEGKPIVTWKYTKDTEDIDKAILKADYPEVYQACMKRKKGFRKFYVVPEKIDSE